MRKGTLLLAIVFAFSAATAASAAKRTKMVKDPAAQAQTDSWALFTDAFHPWSPSTAMPHKVAHHKKGKMKKT
jgi:hypothetical protein